MRQISLNLLVNSRYVVIEYPDNLTINEASKIKAVLVSIAALNRPAWWRPRDTKGRFLPREGEV